MLFVGVLVGMVGVGVGSVVRVVLLGFGNVGRALVRVLSGECDFVRVVGVLSSRGGVLVGHEADFNRLLFLAERGLRLDVHPRFERGLGLEGLFHRLEDGDGVDLVFVSIPPSYETGEPNLGFYRWLFSRGVSVVTADKTGLALDYECLMRLARVNNVFFGYRATVAAGTPMIDLARGLRGRGVKRLDAVLNACTNYLLSLVENGYTWSMAVEKAREIELTEPDPRVDLDGWDPAAKIAILANELGLHRSIRDVERIALDSYSEEDVRQALKGNKRVKYIASIDFEEKKLSVKPMMLNGDHPLAKVSGIYNAAWIELENEHVFLEGPAGPAWRTAKVMLTDLREYMLMKRSPK